MEKVSWRSLPNKPQLFILALCRLSEPLSNTCLLPYLYQLVRSLQPPETRTLASISRQSGLLVALFALAQFATSVPWTSFASRWGRKPTIIIGLILSIISNVGFGFSRSIVAVMCWRVLAGVGNGNIGVMRTMTAEIVKERKYQSRAFILLPLVFNCGNVLGLAIGGALAQPVLHLPWLFGPSGILNFAADTDGVSWLLKYPFALPTLFNATVLSGSLFLALYGLKETVEELRGDDLGSLLGRILGSTLGGKFVRRDTSGYAALHTDDSEDSLQMSVRGPPIPSSPLRKKAMKSKYSITSRAIYTREVLVTIVSFAILPLHNSAFMQVFPVFLATPPSDKAVTSLLIFNGGLGLSSPQIGLFLSCFSIYGILIQLCIYPFLEAALGTLWTYRLALSLFPIAYILAPYLVFLSSANEALQSLGIIFVLWVQVTARTFSIPSSVILLTNSSPSMAALGAVHGVGNMMNALGRAVGPIIAGVVFGWGLEKGVVGTVWWAYMTVVTIVGVAWTWTLKEASKKVVGVEKGSDAPAG